MDARTGLVFYEKNADDLMAPASTSKLMTALLVFDAAMTQCDDLLVLTAGSNERKEAHRTRLQYHRRHP